MTLLGDLTPGTYVVVGESHAWKSFTLHTDGRVQFVDAKGNHVSTWSASTWSARSPEGESWMAKMKALVDSGALRKETAAEAASPSTDVDVDAAPAPCPHPEHRLGTRGGLRKHQRVCLQCGAVVLARR